MEKYNIIDKIAAGGMAEVFLARSTAAMGLGKFVAIKKMLPDLSEQADFITMFKAEATVAMQLQHRNIVSIYDFGISEDQCYLVMELVLGLNLSQILYGLHRKKIQLSPAMALYIIAEAASGLDHAHDITIHRDISPANLMVSYTGEIKVIDFGIAKVKNVGEETQVGVLKGKLSYMSPEQISGGKLDHRSDIFSLGLVLYEILAGRRVYQSRTEATVLSGAPDEEIPLLQELNSMVDDELAGFVHRAIRIDPVKRYQTMDDFSRELRGFLNRKYPEFAAGDLSQFIKGEFRAEYEGSQERLLGFESKRIAKLEIEGPTVITHAPALSGEFLYKMKKKFRIKWAGVGPRPLRISTKGSGQ